MFFINPAGQKVSEDFADASAFSGGYASVMQDGRWGFISRDFTLAVPLLYDYVDDFHGGGARVALEGGVTIIDHTGQAKTPIAGNVSRVENGHVVVTIDGQFGLVEFASGTFVLEPNFSGMKSFAEGMVPATRDGLMWNYYDQNGNLKWDVGFEGALPFSGGFAKVQNSASWAVIDFSGELVTDFEYDDLGDNSDGMMAFKRGGQWGFLEVTPI
jgi:hypothetical protein